MGEIHEITRTAVLDEGGYKCVVMLSQDPNVNVDEQMEFYIGRILKSLGREVTDEGGLHGFAPWYSGTTASQDYNHLMGELYNNAPWATPVPEWQPDLVCPGDGGDSTADERAEWLVENRGFTKIAAQHQVTMEFATVFGATPIE